MYNELFHQQFMLINKIHIRSQKNLSRHFTTLHSQTYNLASVPHYKVGQIKTKTLNCVIQVKRLAEELK